MLHLEQRKKDGAVNMARNGFVQRSKVSQQIGAYQNSGAIKLVRQGNLAFCFENVDAPLQH